MSNYPFETFPLTKRVGIVNPVANLDARYGPWPTFNDALTGFSSAVRHVGLTVAVTGVGGITEYWYKDGITNNDLILKQTGSGGTVLSGDIIPTVTNYLSTNNVLISGLRVTETVSITSNSETPTLKILQSGTGPALYIEDAANDTTPIIVDQFGTLCVGATATGNSASSSRLAQFISNSGTFKRLIEIRNHGSTPSTFPELRFIRTRSNDVNSLAATVLSAGDVLGLLTFGGGTGLQSSIGVSNLTDSPGGTLSGTRMTFTTHVAETNTNNLTLNLNQDKVGINTINPNEALTVVGTISTSNHRSSEQWNNAFTYVQSNSGNWGQEVLILPSNLPVNTVNTFSPTLYGIGYQAVNNDQRYVFTGDFSQGRTLTLFISGNHESIKRHEVTFSGGFDLQIGGAGQSNIFYTFKNHTTKVTLTRLAGSLQTFIRGTAEIIRTDLNQNQGGLGFINLETTTGPTDFLLQENGARLVIRNFV